MIQSYPGWTCTWREGPHAHSTALIGRGSNTGSDMNKGKGRSIHTGMGLGMDKVMAIWRSMAGPSIWR